MKKYYSIFFLIVFVIIFALVIKVFAVDQIKTNEFFAAGFDSQISSITSSQFTFYIGDDLSGISNPVKSAYFTVSGVYTSVAGGTLELKIDDDSATSKIFSLPSASAPTYFEFIYKDNSNKINPVSAGSYTYTLNIVPSGITISGFGAKFIESHRYKPPSCGGGYPIKGEIISPTFDTGAANGVGFNFIMASGITPVGTKFRVQLAASNCSNGATNSPACTIGIWGPTGSDYLGGSSCATSDYYFNAAFGSSPTNSPWSVEIGCQSNYNNKRYFRYKVILCSSDCSASGIATPQIDNVIVNWSL